MLERIEHDGGEGLVAREWLLILCIRVGEFRANGKSGDQRENEKNQCGPNGAAARGRRRRHLRERRKMHLQNFDRDSRVAVAAVVVNAHRIWMQRREKMVRRY